MTSTMIGVPGGEVWADDSDGGAAPLVLLHPGVGDSRFWEPVLPGRQAAARIPGCELTVVPGMHHLPTLREPALVHATITGTLSRVTA